MAQITSPHILCQHFGSKFLLHGEKLGANKRFQSKHGKKIIEISEINEQRNITIEDSNDNYKHDDVKIKWTILYPRIQFSIKMFNLEF